MSDAIDTEAILREIVEVLEKHSIPAHTVEVNFSLLDQDFDLVFPQLSDYKAGIFYRSLVIDSIPATLRAGRRCPFDELAKSFEQNVLPLAQVIATDIEKEFQEVKAHIHVSHHEHDSRRLHYGIIVACRRGEIG
jgi:glutamine synthetase